MGPATHDGPSGAATDAPIGAAIDPALRAALLAPKVAWPTLLLGLVVAPAFALVGIAGARGLLPVPVAVALSTLIAFFAFTPLHDAAHGSAAKHRALNGLIGRLAALPLAAPFLAFRYVHLEHHKHTNDPEKDPDHYSGRGPVALLPLRWLTQDLHYYALILRAASSRPRGEMAEIALTVLAQLAAFGALVSQGFLVEALLFWALPSRLAIAALAFSFDYLPHVPHDVKSRDDRYRATHILLHPGLTALFLWQNYHLIHHLFPGVPFYRYARIFGHKRDELRARGARIVDLRGRARRTSSTSRSVSP